jgi:hypothetical protein
MKTGMAVAMVVLAAGVLFGGLGCQRAYNPGPEWTVAYTTDFSGPAPEWTLLEGKPEVASGMLVVNGPEQETQLILKDHKFPGSVLVECVGSVSGATVSDISPILNADDSGYSAGYLLQFGGKSNTLDRLLKQGEEISSTVKNQPLLMPGKTYHVVAASDGGKISLLVDGVEVFQYTDASPLKGAGHDLIGFYTYHTILKLDKVTVYVKKAESAGKK